jgi:glycosyltransferase involved in cell wall biosynthesis
VPVLLEEYVHEYPDPKEKYNISGFTFLCLGRISFIKGQDIALKAFLKAFKEMPGSCLVFVGREDFEPDFFAHLKEIIPPELVKRIVFTGVVPREEVIAWLQHADMHVIPVRFMNSGAVVVETWAAKTPVLQSDVVDPNLVVEGKNGYLFKSENVDDLADQMLKTYQNKNMLSEMAQNGYELVKKKYSYAALLQLYQDTYDKILNH